MPAFLEEKLKREYAGQDPSIPYRIMNRMGAMRGNKTTEKGRMMERKHARDIKRGKRKGGRRY